MNIYKLVFATHFKPILIFEGLSEKSAFTFYIIPGWNIILSSTGTCGLYYKYITIVNGSFISKWLKSLIDDTRRVFIYDLNMFIIQDTVF
jgi:hypothetical protein